MVPQGLEGKGFIHWVLRIALRDTTFYIYELPMYVSQLNPVTSEMLEEQKMEMCILHLRQMLA